MIVFELVDVILGTMPRLQSPSGYRLTTSLVLILSGVALVRATNGDFQFTSNRYSATIKECSVSCEKLYVQSEGRMGIFLPYKPQEVRYKVMDKGDAVFKSEDYILGDFAFLFIRTRTDSSVKPNREQQRFYSVNVRARVTLMDGKVIHSNTTVDITILDVNDASPLFTQLEYNVEVPDTTPVFATIGAVYASDADEGINAEIYYSFEKWMPEFAVHPTSGTVYLTRNLTASASKMAYANFVVADNRGHGRQTKVPITFTIVQRNQFKPMFSLTQRPPLNAYTQPRTTILIIRVSDMDSGPNGEVDSVLITSATSQLKPDVMSYFSLIPSTVKGEYQLEVAKVIHDLGRQVNITMQATDRGIPKKTSSVTIPIDIENISTAAADQETIKLEVEESMPLGSPLYYIPPPKGAIDATYRIEQDTLGGAFKVHSTSGVLFLQKHLDAERLQHQISIQVKVIAKMGLMHKIEVIRNFQITILDDNDNAPVFASSKNIVINENARVGDLVFIATATDVDAGENGKITYTISSDGPFNIDPFTGKVTLKTLLDYETGAHTHHVFVRASDRGRPYRRETEKVFTVTVQNVNDNPPVFEYDNCSGRISKDAPLGTTVTTVSALDLDLLPEVEITYSLLAGAACMRINAKSGVLSTNCPLTNNESVTIQADITASDGLHEATPITVKVKVVNPSVMSGNNGTVQMVCSETAAKTLLADNSKASSLANPRQEEILLPASPFLSNNHAPKFLPSLTSQFALPEDLALGSIVTFLEATDSDAGFAGLIQFLIEEGNSLGHFAINSSTGALIVLAPLDRETVQMYKLVIVARDMASIGPRSASTTINMAVIDANDNVPRFLRGSYEAYVNETSRRGTEVLRVMAEDLDEGPNGQIRYVLLTDTLFFAIDGHTGYISVRNPLDREKKDIHVLEVKAIDSPEKQEEARSSVVTVTLYISDANDNAPTFLKDKYKAKVREDMSVGTVITNLVAQDMDLPQTGGEVSYKIVKGDEGKFDIDRTTGIVRVLARLDYETRSSYLMTIRAKDNGTEPLSSTCVLEVEVVDVNENFHRPQCTELVYSGLVRENLPAGSKVMQVNATDEDIAPSDSKLSYSIRRGSGLGHFTIDSNGWIRTATVLDREAFSSYWLTVYFQDHGTVPLSSSVEVYIEVLDTNDNRPEPEQPVYYASVPENSPPGVVVASVKASDKDGASDITFDITGGNAQSLFSIDSKQGIIRTTKRQLDRETSDRHTLEVTINDGGSPSLSATVQVWITVSDVNDNKPEFGSTMGKVTVPVLRSHNLSQPIYRALAKDADAGSNGKVRYSLSETEAGVLWRIDQFSGEIYMLKDWEQASVYILQINAMDEGQSPLMNSLDVQFDLVEGLELSRSSPVFQSLYQEVIIAETASVFTIVDEVLATDPDSSRLWYSIIDGSHYNGYPMFIISPETGLVHVAGTLDYESKSMYNMTISATDGFHSAFTTLNVKLTNVNEHQPWFSQKLYEVSVSEKVKAGTPVLTVSATDNDENDNLVYLIHSATNNDSYALFGIDHRTGVISTLTLLDHETTQIHDLIVKVNDNGVRIFSDYTRVRIRVEDHNDHPPKFVGSTFTVRVHELLLVGSSVTQVQATDQDKGDNAQISYSISSGNIGYTFGIDAQLGIVTLAKPLDKSIRSEFELTVVAKDMGTPPLSSSCLIKVQITEAELQPPLFESLTLTAEIAENEPAGSFIIALSGESQSSLTFEIINDDGCFSVNPNSGILTSNQVFDHEAQDMYNVSISATDIMGHKVTLMVVVHVLDRNDNCPKFKQLVYYGTVSEGALDGSAVLAEGSVPLILEARDDDSNLNALLLFTIMEPEARRHFEIEANTGALRTTVTPDREVRSIYEFNVQVQDQGEGSLKAANPARVIITVDDINDTPPKFAQRNYSAVLLTPTYQNVEVLTVRARDPDLNPELTYSIVGGNADERFSVEPDTGLIYIGKPHGLTSFYDLRVKVSDGLHDAVAEVTIQIEETASASSLKFSQAQYSGSAVENTTEVQSIVLVYMLDTKLGQPITYTLLNQRDKFDIGSTSGVLQTKQGVVLDREQKASYEVIVRVQSSTELAQIPVQVTVLDINDNPPFFIKEPYYTVVSVSAQKGQYIAKVTALDTDEGDNRHIRYDITGAGDKRFRINRKTGEVFLKTELVATDANAEYKLNISATDGGNPTLSATTEMNVKVITATTPIFNMSYYRTNVSENIPIGSAVLTLSANSPMGNKIIYSIVGGDLYNEFTVHYSTAMDYNGPCTIRVNDDLNFETTPNYTLLIRAVDTVTGDWSDALVNVRVQDVNDQRPIFERLDYFASVSEALTPGSHVLTLNAVDHDQGINSKVYYTIRQLKEDDKQHLKFEIKTDTQTGAGRIHTVTSLDHESDPQLEFVVVATDGGNPRLSSEAYVHIKLIDLNDNAPRFEEQSYFVEITDQVRRGQFVALVGAIDADQVNEGELMYSIVDGNDGQSFSMIPRTGSVIVSPFHEPVQFQDVYALNISVTDGVYTSFTSLTISVLPANRHTPEFERMIYDFHVPENSEVGMIIGKVEAKDRDHGKFGALTYSLVGDSILTYFRIQSDSGEIVLKKSLDRELKDFFMIPTTAQDGGGKMSFTSVYVEVLDVNDNRPEFHAKSYNAAVSSSSLAKTSVLSVSAFDLDKGANQDRTYSMVTSDPDVQAVFSMKSDSGKIALRRNLSELDEGKEFSFFVRVTDGGREPLDSTAAVTVVCTAQPLLYFPLPEAPVFLNESVPIGSRVYKADAAYAGEATFSYRIVSGSSRRTNEPASFVIDSTGLITTIAPLDSEDESRFELLVEAYTHTTPELVASLLVRVHPIDHNDNPPSFTSEHYLTRVAESVPVGSNILQVSAFDVDVDHSTGITYSFAEQSASMSNLFMIDPFHGRITTLVPLDRERQASYEFFVTANDQDIRGALMQTAKVTIELIDVNDEPPTFPKEILITAVNEDAPNGTIVVKLETVDRDLPQHATKMYYISGGNDKGHFRIKQTGEIFVSKPLNREQINEYELQVSATDGVFVSQIRVRIAVLDANDNAPKCEQPVYTKILREDIDAGTVVLRVLASDDDEYGFPNSKITYSLRGVGAADFAVDKVRGDIRVAKRLDRERIAAYELMVIAQDGGGLECSSDVKIILTDVNDNEPVFDQSEYSFTLPEDSVNNTLLLRVTATDKDSGEARRVQYSVLKGASDTFIIDPNNGIVRLVKPLRREMGEMFNLTLAATDQGTPPRTGTALLFIHISDVNDPPVFERSVYDFTIPEDVAVNSTLLRIKATSSDTGMNNIIRYRITDGGADGQLFHLHPVTGELITAGNFDFELVREYVLTAEAVDAGTPPLSDTCIVTIHITDVNDNKPNFSQATYSASAREDAKIGDHVIQVQAQDLDSGAGSDIVYSILSGNEFGHFKINPLTGYLSVQVTLDRELIANYSLLVQAQDRGVPAQSSSVIILVYVLDINDNSPVFSRAEYSAQVQVYPEGGLYRNITFLLGERQETDFATSMPKSSINKEGQGFTFSPLTFIVSDNDLPTTNGPFRFEIISGDPDNNFDITASGVLLARGHFDMKIQNKYSLVVRVSDSGTPALSSSATVSIEVKEATLHPPHIVSPRNFSVVAYEDMFPGGVIGHVSATDADQDILMYSLVSPDMGRLFSVDQMTGAIGTYALDGGVYLLNVSASDGRFTRYGIVEVTVTSISDEMLEESVGITLEGITALEFVSVHRPPFERAIKSLSIDISRLYIINVADEGKSPRGKRETSRSVLVVIAAATASGQVIAKERLSQVIRSSETTIESMLGGLLISLPLDSRTCGLTCGAEEKCKILYVPLPDRVTLHTDHLSFVALNAQPAQKCVCMGSACVDPCLRLPCPRNKLCVRGERAQQYSCQCPKGLFGNDCDVASGSPISFTGSSYARWTLSHDIEKRLQVKLRFRTKQADAVLMDARGDRDFSTLEISNGRAQYRFECGSGVASVKTTPKVNDGLWHEINLERNGNLAKLVLDNVYTAEVESRGDNQVINLSDKNVYFGAIVKPFSTASDGIQSGFRGCMDSIHIDRTLLLYGDSNAVASGAKFSNVRFDCLEEFYGECSINPCLNGGSCIETADGALCSCKGYDGLRCEKDLNECDFSSPCGSGSTCVNTPGSFVCLCAPGMTGSLCKQIDVCLSNPCSDGSTCINLPSGTFECQCRSDRTGASCMEEKSILLPGDVSTLTVVYIVVGALGIIAVVIVIVLVAFCMRKRRRGHNNPDSGVSRSKSFDDSDMFYSRGSKATGGDLYQRAPSPLPPSVPPRPASYTPSVRDQVCALNNFDIAQNYGSAGDGLDHIGHMSAFSKDYRELSKFTKSSFSAVPRLDPPAPSVSDTDSIRKPAWEFESPNIIENLSGNGDVSCKPKDKRIPGMSQASNRFNASRGASKAESKGGSRGSSKPTSITNGSFASLAQDEESYHWDTSDWALQGPVVRGLDPKGSRSPADSQHSEENNLKYNQPYLSGPAARLVSMSEVDDSEYVEDSELDDDTIPTFQPSYNVDDILALNKQYKFDSYPDINVPEPNRNHYLPRHVELSPLVSKAKPQRSGVDVDATKPLLSGRVLLDSPAVPKRSASLSYSTDDVNDGADEPLAMEGYTSMEAGDSQSELSDNICEIESDAETDLEAIISKVRNDKQSLV